jgi:hypothetical protein
MHTNRKGIQRELDELRLAVEECRLDAQKTKGIFCRIIDLIDRVYNER